ncbi:MAG TPA: hypothetical protein VK421_00845 [Pyrinomonadaceae bacterium]|nr:hypothetical protein [Pyrinomonadaceae bacterium]
MHAPANLNRTLAFLIVLVAGLAAQAAAQQKSVKAAAPAAPAGKPVAYRDPGDISKLDLRSGPGSAELAPAAPFTFVAEDAVGASPKITVKDSKGVTWSVKTGVEAQAETVATRLLWAMGYYSEEAYYLDRAVVNNLPKKLARGQEFVRDGALVGARFEPRRANVERGPRWDWEENPFVGTREFNGLKVMMVVLGNYDTRVDNNTVFTARDEQTGELQARYYVSDVGATLGKVGGLGGKRSKNSLEDFRSSKFIEKVENGVVSFDYHTKPKGAGIFASLFKPSYGKSQAKKERAMRQASVEDARWIGQRLSLLSDEQLRDAFRAANYDEATREGFVQAIRQRATMLAGLPAGSIASAQNPAQKED